MTTIQKSQSTLSQTVYEGAQLVPAALRMKHSKMLTAQKYPNGRRDASPINILMPKIDDSFLKTHQGKAIKNAVDFLYYHQVLPSKTKKELYPYLNSVIKAGDKTKKGISFGEAVSYAESVLGQEHLSTEDMRIKALFCELVNIIRAPLKKYLKDNESLEGQNILTSLEQIENSWLGLAQVEVTTGAFTGNKEKTIRLVKERIFSKMCPLFLITLASGEDYEGKTLCLNPQETSLYDDDVGTIRYSNITALFKDLERQLLTTITSTVAIHIRSFKQKN